MSTDKNPNLALVNAKGKLAIVIGANQLETDILNAISTYGDISSLQHEKSLLQDICKRIENATSVVLTGDEKKALVVKIITRLFPILNNERDIAIIKSDIDFLCCARLVKAVSTFKKVRYGLWSLVKKSS